MPYYAGIDLGTTNSAIYTFDGENLRLWKSPDGKDVQLHYWEAIPTEPKDGSAILGLENH